MKTIAEVKWHLKLFAWFTDHSNQPKYQMVCITTFASIRWGDWIKIVKNETSKQAWVHAHDRNKKTKYKNKEWSDGERERERENAMKNRRKMRWMHSITDNVHTAHYTFVYDNSDNSEAVTTNIIRRNKQSKKKEWKIALSSYFTWSTR